MNNIKRTGLGILVAALAFSFSAFTTIRRGAIVKYYKIDTMYPAANNPAGYAYFSGDRCETGGNLCSALWNIGSNPIPVSDGTPLPLSGVSFVTGSVVTGHFE